MPASLRELYAAKLSKSAQETSDLSRELYDQEYLQGILTGAAVGSGPARNYLYGFTKGLQDIVFDTTPPAPAINAKTLTDDIKGLLGQSFGLSNVEATGDKESIDETIAAIGLQSENYKKIFDKVEAGTSSKEEVDDIFRWIDGMKSPVSKVASITAGLTSSIFGENAYSLPIKSQEENFNDSKEKLKTKIQQKAYWLYGQQAAMKEAQLKGDINAFNEFDQLLDFNQNFKPSKLVVTPSQWDKGNYQTIFSANPYLKNIALAGLETLTPGTEEYRFSGEEKIKKGIQSPETFYKDIFEEKTGSGFFSDNWLAKDMSKFAEMRRGGSNWKELEKYEDNVTSGLKAQKGLLTDALNKKAAYFGKIYEKALQSGDVELQKESSDAIKKIQTWFNLNQVKPKEETGFLNAAARTIKTFRTAGAEATQSTLNFITRSERSGIDRFVDYGKTPIRVPMDINSDGVLNNLDQDSYGNPIFSDQFHYRGKDGEWKTNWAGLPEASARVIGQMVPTIVASALTEGASLSLLGQAATGAEGVMAARNLNLVQKGILEAKKINEFKVLGQELRLLDRAATMATVTASTYDMMLDQELMYTNDINAAKSRALGRAAIEGTTEMIGVPVFGIFRTGKFGIRTPEAVNRLANATLPGALTRTQTIGLYLNNMLNVGKTVVGQSIAESFEEVAADLGNYMMTNYIKEADKGYVREDEVSGDHLINTFTEAFFTMLPFTGATSAISAVGEYSKGNRLGAAQWMIANNPEQAVSYIKSQLDSGKIDGKEAQRRVNEVNKLSATLNGMEDIKAIKDLRTLLDDPDAQRRYFNAVVHRTNLAEIDYESLTPEQKEALNRYNLNEIISEKGKAEMERIRNKQVPRTAEQTARLDELKNKKDKTKEEESEFAKLSEQGTLNPIDLFKLEQLNKLTAQRTLDRTTLSKKDYKAFVDAGIIKEEDLTPKEEDLKEQIKKADAKIYQNKELASKYENLTKDEKDKIVTDLFEEIYNDTRNTMSPTQLVNLSRNTKNQVKLISQFNRLNPLDLNLRQKLADEADARFAELTAVNEEGRTNLAQQLVDEDISNLTVSQAINKYLFMEQESASGYIDKTTKEELVQNYLGKIAQNIESFNTATPEQQLEILIDHFESSPIEQRFEYETTLQDWTVMRGETAVQANITEELFDAAQAEYYKRRTQNRLTGQTDTSVSTVPQTDISQPIGAAEAAAQVTQQPGQYDETESVVIPQANTLEQDTERTDRFDFAANSIIEQMKAKGYTDYAKTTAATFSLRANEDIERAGANKASNSTHQKVLQVLKDIVLGKKTGVQGSAEIKAILDQEMPESDPKNLLYREKAVFYAFVAETVHHLADENDISQSEIEQTLASETGLVTADFKVETSTDDNSSHESADLLEKERTLALQVAQVYSWVNPLRTAAFETNEAQVSEDPARVRNAEILNFVQENPNPERKIQVSSREYFYRQVLGNNYDGFVERLKSAIEDKDVSEKTLNELQAFFGGDFFATFPTATGEAELIYLINQKGKGFLFEPTPIVTFVVNGELEMFESNGKMYPFYANLTLAKHLASITKEVEGPQAREVPTVVRDFKEANPKEFNEMVQSGLALLEDLKAEVTKNTNTRVVFEMDRITMGSKIGARIADLSEVSAPMEITFKSKVTEENGMSYPGVIGSGIALIDNEPYLLFNKFVEEVGGMAEIEALAEILFNPEVRSKFFDENQEVIDYFAKHYNIFAAGSRKLEFSVKNGELKMFSVSVEGGKKKFTPIATKEEFVAFMTKTDTPGIRYNVSKKGLGTNTSMFIMRDGEVVEEIMSYTEFVKRTHRVLTSTDNTLRNKQIVFNEVSLRDNVTPRKPAAPTSPAPAASPVIAPKVQPEVKEEAKKLSKVPSAPLISPKSVQDVEKALTALDEKRLIPNPENEDVYIEVDDKGNRIPGTPEWTRASTIAGKFDGGKKHANRGTIVDSMLREFVSGNVESVEDLIRIYENHPLKNETNAFSRKFMEDLFDTFSEVKESTDAAGIKLLATTRTLWGEINGKLYAGTIDLLGIDKEGKVYIIDLKTSTGNRRNTAGRYYESNRKKDSTQQSAYGELLRQRTGITVSNLVIFPVQTPLTTIDGVETYDSAIPNKSEDNKFTLPVVIDTDIFPKTPAVNVAPEAPVTTEAKPETKEQAKPVAPTLSFPTTIPYNTAAKTLESVSKLLWEQLPKQYQGKVVKQEDGTFSYYVKGYEKFPNLETKISFMVTSQDGSAMYDLHNFMLTDLFPDVLEEDTVIPGPFEVRPKDLNLGSLQIRTTYSENGVNNTSSFPKPVRESIDIQSFNDTLLNMLTGQPGAVPPTPTIQENKDAVGETIKPSIFDRMKQEEAAEKAAETVVTENPFTDESPFTEEENSKAEEIQNNCILPGKKRPTSKIQNKTSKK
jgi:hypothetical protein